ncbi:MAG: GNAT family N-acetyltransferase [Candidatus Coproplasma sp.]
MIVDDFSIILKDGRKAVLRSPKPEDVDGIIEYLLVSAGETDYILRYPEECEKYTRENESEFLKQVNSSDNRIMLICEVDGRIAGNCEISFGTNLKTKHRASVGVALMSEFWNLGIGTAMFGQLIKFAEERKDVLQIELDFVEGNARARALYEKVGFRITGVKPDAIRLKDGTLLNEYMMIKKLNR